MWKILLTAIKPFLMVERRSFSSRVIMMIRANGTPREGTARRIMMRSCRTKISTLDYVGTLMGVVAEARDVTGDLSFRCCYHQASFIRRHFIPSSLISVVDNDDSGHVDHEAHRQSFLSPLLGDGFCCRGISLSRRHVLPHDQ